MAKEKEKRLFRYYFVEKGMTAKDAAAIVEITEKTAGDWVKKFHLVEEREARNASPAKRIGNIKQIISNLSDERLEVDRQVKELEANGTDPEAVAKLRSRISGIDDAVSKWNKTLENIEKENKVSLSVYLYVMDSIFEALIKHNQKLYLDTLEFQEQHVNLISEKLG